MTTTSLLTLRARVRERADMVNSTFVTDTATGLDAWINEANQKLHGMLVDALGEEYTSSSSTFSTVAGQSDYNLPTDFFKLYALDVTVGGTTFTALPYNRAERNLYQSAQQTGWYVPRYMLTGSLVRFLPTPNVVADCKLYFAPDAKMLVDSHDEVSYPNGWERFIVLDAAIQALNKEESSTTALVAERAAVIKEIETTKEARDLATPKRVVDVFARDISPDLGW